MKDNERKLIYKAREALYREMRKIIFINFLNPATRRGSYGMLITALHCIEFGQKISPCPSACRGLTSCPIA